MVHAFVLVKTGPGASPAVVDRLALEENIVEAHVVAGEYDVILELDAEDISDIISFVSAEVRTLDGVLDTNTYVAIG